MTDRPSATARSRLEEGFILDGATQAPLSEAHVVEVHTRTGDHILAATHHGFGYKDVNEDRIAMVERPDDRGVTTAVYVVDGMGGHFGGDISAQYLAEELVSSRLLTADDLLAQTRELLLQRITDTVDGFPLRALIDSVANEIYSRILSNQHQLPPEAVLRETLDIVQSESIQAIRPREEDLAQIARVVHDVSQLTVPGRTEIAMRRARTRLEARGPSSRPPDACFIGGILHTGRDGSRRLDVKQVGDCKLFVADPAGRIRFQSINESLLPEPNLREARLALADLMTYSLHRNIVSNSVGSATTTKRYRSVDVPVAVSPGDVVYLYSDGCDDLFVPEEIVAMARDRSPARFVRSLLGWSERRMRLVSAMLEEEQRRRTAHNMQAAYPAVHHRINRDRVANGAYEETYQDGKSGRWTRPPKCDNIAFCMLRVGDGRP